MKKYLLSAVALGAVAAFSAPASAALVTCPASFIADGTAKVFNGGNSAVSGCQILTPPSPSNVGNIANINAAGFFGYSDWVSNSQTQIDSNASSGSWTINGVDFAAYDYIIVFKSGQGTNLTAFLFNEEFASGNWSTPFTDPPFDFPGAATKRDVSHYTIAKRYNPTTTEVPEPAMIGLRGLGRVGLSVARRRKAA